MKNMGFIDVCSSCKEGRCLSHVSCRDLAVLSFNLYRVLAFVDPGIC